MFGGPAGNHSSSAADDISHTHPALHSLAVMLLMLLLLPAHLLPPAVLRAAQAD